MNRQMKRMQQRQGKNAPAYRQRPPRPLRAAPQTQEKKKRHRLGSS